MATPEENNITQAALQSMRVAYTALYRETAKLAADNIRLTTVVKHLLAAVDFTAPPRADVRVCNLWGAATALQELQELMKGEADAQ